MCNTCSILKRIEDLIEHSKTELEYALPCYEDGTLSPRRSLQYIQEELNAIHNQLIDLQYLPRPYLKPPATPEALQGDE